MRSDVYLFFGIIFFIFIVWIATGGPSRPISFAGPYILPLAPGTTPTGYSLSRTASTTVSHSSGWTSNTLRSVQQDVVTLEKAVVSSTRFGDPSPHKGAVTIRHSIGGLGATDPDKEYISLYASSGAGSGVTITGWKIYSEALGHSFTIPQGASTPTSGIVNRVSPIVLLPGQTATITVGDSPVGFSFRTNLCTGYFEEFQNFTPSLSLSCPTPSSDFDRFYLGNEHSLDACKAYLRTVPRCTIPNNEPSNIADDCYHFIDTYLNYNGCVVAHEGDAGFFGTEWRIFVKRDDAFFTKAHDTIKLLDENGKTVDLFSY